MKRRLRVLEQEPRSIYFAIICLAFIALQLVFNCHSSYGSSASKKLDKSLTTKRIFSKLKALLKDSDGLKLNCFPEKGVITFYSKKPVNYRVRIPNMVGELQKPRVVLGPADGGFKGNIKLIQGDTSLYQAIYPQSFRYFFNRGDVLFTEWAWAPYSKKFNFHIRANFAFPRKNAPPQLSKFARFVTEWEELVQTVK